MLENVINKKTFFSSNILFLDVRLSFIFSFVVLKLRLILIESCLPSVWVILLTSFSWRLIKTLHKARLYRIGALTCSILSMTFSLMGLLVYRRNGELYLEVSPYPSFDPLFLNKNLFFVFCFLQFHRGTYTSHGSIKKGNRVSEILLRDLEVMSLRYGGDHIYHLTSFISQQIATLASLCTYHNDKGYIYPKKRIDVSWEKVLLNQCECSSEACQVLSN